MASVNLCDRCEAFGKGEVMGVLEHRVSAKMSWTKEICAECSRELDKWMTTPSPERKGTSVTEPYTVTPKASAVDKELAKYIAQEYAKAQAEINRHQLEGPTNAQD